MSQYLVRSVSINCRDPDDQILSFTSQMEKKDGVQFGIVSGILIENQQQENERPGKLTCPSSLNSTGQNPIQVRHFVYDSEILSGCCLFLHLWWYNLICSMHLKHSNKGNGKEYAFNLTFFLHYDIPLLNTREKRKRSDSVL